jgi:hypothetical protein
VEQIFDELPSVKTEAFFVQMIDDSPRHDEHLLQQQKQPQNQTQH